MNIKQATRLANYKYTHVHKERGDKLKEYLTNIPDWTPRSVVDKIIKILCPVDDSTGHDTIGIHAYLVQIGFFEARHCRDSERYDRNNWRLEVRTTVR